MKRRTVLKTAAAATLGALLPTHIIHAHTPYRQWEVYRRKHLLIGCHRDDPSSYALSKGVVATLADQLPEARSRVARGPNAGRIASLMATRQMDLAILQPDLAAKMSTGAGLFAAWGPINLTRLLTIGEYHLVAFAEFPTHHAWQVARALQNRRAPVEVADTSNIPEHPGASAFFAGLPMPHDHAHNQ